jgi:peptidyl-prolyl cis-trans isomerase A (cyclophilin A)
MNSFTKLLMTGAVVCSTLVAQAPASKSAGTSKSAASKGADAKGGAAAKGSLLNPATLNAKAPDLYKAQFTTTKGDFVVEVHRDWAPLGADRFYNLVRNGFFTNSPFFRVVPGFIVQFGLNANPAVNKVWEHAAVKDDPVMGSNSRGTLVFATAGPNTRTTQLFINFGNNAGLDRQGFAPFGTVVEGMDTVVDKIYAGYGERPDQQKIIEEGDAYISKDFPMIDKIKMARIVPAAPAGAPADKGAADKK